MTDLPVPKAEAKPGIPMLADLDPTGAHSVLLGPKVTWAIASAVADSFAEWHATPNRDAYVRVSMERAARAAVEAVAPVFVAAGRAQAAADIREYALNYPADVFPPDSDVRDAIAGTAMRHAYNNAAEIAEGEADLSKDPT